MSDNPPSVNRRDLCKWMAAGVSAAAIAPHAVAETFTAPTPIDIGKVENGSVKFPPWRGSADTPSSPPPAPLPPEQRVGFAIVGLGRLSLEQILPAFGKSLKARPVALVSGTPGQPRSTCPMRFPTKASACR